MNIGRKISPVALILFGVALNCATVDESNANSNNLPEATNSAFKYIGGFRIRNRTFGASKVGYTQGSMALTENARSFFIIGHRNQQAIAEFPIPPLVNSVNLADLNFSDSPLQNFVTLLDRVPSGNTDTINRLTGIEYINGKIIANGVEYYDANYNATDTTFVIQDPSDLANSALSGFFKMTGKAHAAGWMTEVPPEWSSTLGTSYITGYASNVPINGRHSIGPAAFSFDATATTQLVTAGSQIQTEAYLDFSLTNPLATDSLNTSGTNNLWTENSEVIYGFIIPGTNTYMTIGSSGGHVGGIGYKITQDNGTKCNGYCTYLYDDYLNHVWYWRVSDLLKVKNGELEAHELRPYQYGEFIVPFQTAPSGHNKIVGADFDKDNNQLYLLLEHADNLQSRYEGAPLMVVYQFTPPKPKPEALSADKITIEIKPN